VRRHDALRQQTLAQSQKAFLLLLFVLARRIDQGRKRGHRHNLHSPEQHHADRDPAALEAALARVQRRGRVHVAPHQRGAD
jgi:hypothetical protein